VHSDECHILGVNLVRVLYIYALYTYAFVISFQVTGIVSASFSIPSAFSMTFVPALFPNKVANFQGQGLSILDT
jgi:hypothetical protein